MLAYTVLIRLKGVTDKQTNGRQGHMANTRSIAVSCKN